MTEFNLIKNVEKEFDVSISSEFVVNEGFAAKFIAGTYLVAGSYQFIVNPTADIEMAQTLIGTTTIGKGDGGSSIEIVGGTTDCGLHQNDSGWFRSDSNYLELGNVSVNNKPAKVWIPFTVPTLTQGQQIVSAKLYLTASESDSSVCKVKIGCDKNITAVAPTNYDALNILTIYGTFTSATFENWTTDTQYSYDITDAVQEIIDDADWETGFVLGILIFNNGSALNADRTCYSGDYTTSSKRPKLIITY
jgi:hypothetical protein